MLGIENVKGGSAKFPGIRYRRASGLSVDQYGIDGNYGFGLPQSPTDLEWASFRGGAGDVIHPGQLTKIARLRQCGENKGIVAKWPNGTPKFTRWLFKPIEVEFEISAEDMPIINQTKSIPTASKDWKM